MYGVLLKTGAWATADDERGILLAAAWLRREAVQQGASPRVGRETIVVEYIEAPYDQWVYRGSLTEEARAGRTR